MAATDIDDDSSTNTGTPARKKSGGVQTIAALPNYPAATSATVNNASSTPANADTAYSQNGKPLGYGKTINGIATFSDGSSPGSIATLSPDIMQKLRATSVAPSDTYNGPEGGVVSSALTQLTGNTGIAAPTQNQMVATSALNRGISGLPQGYDPSAAAAGYKSDIASIINRDPRSISGTAAHNAEADAIWNRNTGNGGAGNAAFRNSIGSLEGQAKGAFDAENQAGIDEANNATRNSIASMEGLTSRNNAALNYNTRLAAAEARSNALGYAADSRADATRYAADARGSAARDVANTNAARPRIDATAQKRIGDILSKVGLSPEEKHQAISEYMNTLGQYGLQGGQSPAGSAAANPNSASTSTSSRIPPAAIDHLRRNPNLADQFDAKYGKGASAGYLGGQ